MTTSAPFVTSTSTPAVEGERAGRLAAAGSVLFPSDLVDAREGTLPTDGGSFALGGRVVGVDHEGVVLADAFATVRVRSAHGTDAGADRVDLALGDLVVVEAVAEGLTTFAYRAVLERDRPAKARDLAREQKRFVAGSADQRASVGRNLRERARAMKSVRAFFEERAFLEVETPARVPSPGSDLHLDAVEASGQWLITSPEYQMKRLLVGGVPRIFQIAHVFRAGEIGVRHNPEFTMLEWYRAFASMSDVMRDTEELVGYVAEALTGKTSLVLPHDPFAKAHGQSTSAVPGGRERSIDLRLPFDRISVAEAFARHADVSEARFFELAEHDEETFFRVLVDQVEPALATYAKPVFLVGYPISQASLARPDPQDPRLCERFELYLGGVELCNGFGELVSPVEQRRRLLHDQELRQRAGKPVYPIDEKFVASLEEGMPRASGNALGLDRLVALCLGARTVSEVIAFPAEHI